MGAVAPEPEPSREQLVLPTFEGYEVTKCNLNFGGNVPIRGQDIAEALRLNAEVELLVRGRVISRKHSVKADGDGHVDETVTASTLFIDDVEAAGDISAIVSAFSVAAARREINSVLVWIENGIAAGDTTLAVHQDALTRALLQLGEAPLA